MTCDAARELLLTADPAELDGRTGSPLADHLRTCAACRAAAERLVMAQRAWSEALGGGPGQTSGAEREAAQVALRSAGHRRATARRVRLGLPLAAAVLAGLLVLHRNPESSFSLPGPDAGPVPARFAVTAPPGRNVLVLQQPDTAHVIVVWFF